MIVKLDMSLGNEALYKNCDIEEVGGRKNLLTPPCDAGNLIGRNVHDILKIFQGVIGKSVFSQVLWRFGLI
jgi:hypothetical protein